jgi:hypothetical protein
VVADIKVVGGAFTISLTKVDAASVSVPAAAKDYLAGLATRSVQTRLPALPFGLKLQAVTVRPEGLAITAAGVDVPLVSTGAAS